jgi:Tfp pilus assembly PilM family ATPase/Tfp pilus assembly protein PilN
MKFSRSIKEGCSVGLEITPVILRAVEIKVQGRETIIQRLASIPAPEGSVLGDRIVDPAAVVAALRQLWEQGRFSTRRCALAVPVGALSPHMLTVPPAPPAEQRRIMAGELSRFAPIDSGTPMGWMPMAAGGGPGGNALAFLAEPGMISTCRQAAAAAGLELDACEPDAVAALRTVELGLRSQTPVAAVYVSPACSEMAFLDAGRVRYYRRLDRGIAEALPAPGWDPLMGNGHRGPATSAGLEDLALEIKRSLQHYGRAYANAPQPQKVLLLGDSPALEQLAELVRAESLLEAEHLHPVHLYRHASALTDQQLLHAGGQYAVALGMALRPLADPQMVFALDLKAGDDAQVLARRAPRYLMAALSGSTVVVVASLVASLGLSSQLNRLRGELNAAQAEMQAAHTQAEMTVAQVRQARFATQRLRKQAMPVPQLLTRVARLVPEAVALTGFELKEDGSLTLEGDARSPRQVDTFLQQLADDARFCSPNLDTLDAGSQGGLAHFKVQTGLVGYGKAGEKHS